MKHQCKITVLETKAFPELQGKHLADPKSRPCPCFKVGDEFILDITLEKDNFYHLMNGKFCEQAWDVVACCNDGTRLIVFKIERIDIPENEGVEEWLAKHNFKNSAEDAYAG